MPRRRQTPSLAAPAAKEDPIKRFANWASFVAWLSLVVGLALADSARPSFRSLRGINRMFQVRPSSGDVGNLHTALVLFAITFVVSAMGMFLASSLKEQDSRIPIHLIVTLPASIVAVCYYFL